MLTVINQIDCSNHLSQLSRSFAQRIMGDSSAEQPALFDSSTVDDGRTPHHPVSQTKKLPGIVLFHHNMRVRFTTTIQQPFAVQDVEGTVVGFDPDPADDGTKSRLLSTSSRTAEWPCRLMPKAIYVKIDECAYQFLPPGTCALHRQLGHDDQ